MKNKATNMLKDLPTYQPSIPEKIKSLSKEFEFEMTLLFERFSASIHATLYESPSQSIDRLCSKFVNSRGSVAHGGTFNSDESLQIYPFLIFLVYCSILKRGGFSPFQSYQLLQSIPIKHARPLQINDEDIKKTLESRIQLYTSYLQKLNLNCATPYSPDEKSLITSLLNQYEKKLQRYINSQKSSKE